MTNEQPSATVERAPNCLAEEWIRDGRGFWAVRKCIHPTKHGGKAHAFSPWSYYAKPPYLIRAEAAEATVTATAAQVSALEAEKVEAIRQLDVLQGQFNDAITQRDALAAELRALRAQQAWQPIETAPKDGTQILLCGPKSPGWRPSIVDGSWNRGGAMHAPHWMGGIFEPTHWQPLPSAPRAGGAETEGT